MRSLFDHFPLPSAIFNGIEVDAFAPNLQTVNNKQLKKTFGINEDTITVGHPAISPDELTLYFVAQMRKGKGGKDIWKVSRSSNTAEWGKAENLGDNIKI